MDRHSPDSKTEPVGRQGIHGYIDSASVDSPDVQFRDVQNQDENLDQSGSRPETIKQPVDQQDIRPQLHVIPASPEAQEGISSGHAEDPLPDNRSNASTENSDQDDRPFCSSNNGAGRLSLPTICTSYTQIGKSDENQALYMKRRSLPAKRTPYIHVDNAEQNQTLYADNPVIETEETPSKYIYNTETCNADNEVHYQLKGTSPKTPATAYQCGIVNDASEDRPDIEVENVNEAEDEAETRPKIVIKQSKYTERSDQKAESTPSPDNEFIRPYAVAYCRDRQANGEQDVQPYAVAYDEQDGHYENQTPTGRSVNNPRSGNRAVSSDECIRPYAVRYQLDGQTNGDQDDTCDVQPYAVAYDVQDGHYETQTPTGRCADSSQPGSTAEAVDDKAGGLRPNPMYSGNGLRLNPMYAHNVAQPRAGYTCVLTRSCLSYVITTGVVVTVMTVLSALIIVTFLPGKENNHMLTTWTQPTFTAKTTSPTFTDTTTDDATLQADYTSSPTTSNAENEDKELEQTTIVFGGEGEEPGQFDGPRAVVVSSSNEIFVADTYNRRVQVFNMTGVYLRHFPAVISGESSETIEPEDISIDGEGHLWVFGDKNDDVTGFIVRYTKMGAHLATLRATYTNNSFCAITTDALRNLVVVTEFWGDYGEVKLLHYNGTVVRKFRTEKGPEYPGRVAVGREGNLFLSDHWGDTRVYVYNNTGHYLSSFGGDRIGEVQTDIDERVVVDGIRTDSSGNVLVGTGVGGTVEMFTRDGRHHFFSRGRIYPKFGFTTSGRTSVKSMREPFAVESFADTDSGVYTCVEDKGSLKKKYDVMICVIPKPKTKKKHPSNLQTVPVKNNTNICVTPQNPSLIPSGSSDQNLCVPATNDTQRPKAAYIVPITVANILMAMLLTAVFYCLKQRAARNTAAAAMQVGLQAMAVRNPVNAMVDVEEEAITNFPQSLQCDETQSAAEATGSQSQYVTEPVTTHTAEAEIHIYSNDDTSIYSDDDEEAIHHQYASAAPPPVPDDDDDDSNPGQETTGYSTEMVQEDDSTSQMESGDDINPYGIAAANVVYQATAVHHSLSHGNPTAVQQSLSYCNPTAVQQSLSYDNPTAVQQSLSYGNPTAVQQSLSYDNPTAARQSLSYDNPATNYSVANANDVEMDSHLPTNTLYGEQSASASPAEAAVNPLYGGGPASAQ
uniref:SMP-30/Gluconolactonase/LRE-like region domain-containing protein n=1 Tax=Branchiostoma floridae TaxID=7739 RepID=C3YHC0_BRAFL|eukprot:XP_002604345.1 hypothetical protein BRAFLDRAFT_85435 [Branchiostoma floridae]